MPTLRAHRGRCAQRGRSCRCGRMHRRGWHRRRFRLAGEQVLIVEELERSTPRRSSRLRWPAGSPDQLGRFEQVVPAPRARGAFGVCRFCVQQRPRQSRRNRIADPRASGVDSRFEVGVDRHAGSPCGVCGGPQVGSAPVAVPGLSDVPARPRLPACSRARCARSRFRWAPRTGAPRRSSVGCPARRASRAAVRVFSFASLLVAARHSLEAHVREVLDPLEVRDDDSAGVGVDVRNDEAARVAQNATLPLGRPDRSRPRRSRARGCARRSRRDGVLERGGNEDVAGSCSSSVVGRGQEASRRESRRACPLLGAMLQDGVRVEAAGMRAARRRSPRGRPRARRVRSRARAAWRPTLPRPWTITVRTVETRAVPAQGLHSPRARRAHCSSREDGAQARRLGRGPRRRGCEIDLPVTQPSAFKRIGTVVLVGVRDPAHLARARYRRPAQARRRRVR